MKIKLITMAVIAFLTVGHIQTANATEGNVTTCAQVGFASSIPYEGNVKSSIDNASPFTATVTSDKFVTITNIADGVAIQAIVLKGGNSYEVFLSPVANTQSPLNRGGNIPDLSHWFICYTFNLATTTSAASTTSSTTTNEATTTTGVRTILDTVPRPTTTAGTPSTVTFTPPTELPVTGSGTLWFLFIGGLLVGFGILALRRN